MSRDSTMRASCCAVLIAILTPIAALGQVQGDYQSGPELSLRMVELYIDDANRTLVAADLALERRIGGGCAGRIAGIGWIAGNTLRLSPHSERSTAHRCVVGIRFDLRGTVGDVTEESDCTAWRGVTCEFAGKVVR